MKDIVKISAIFIFILFNYCSFSQPQGFMEFKIGDSYLSLAIKDYWSSYDLETCKVKEIGGFEYRQTQFSGLEYNGYNAGGFLYFIDDILVKIEVWGIFETNSSHSNGFLVLKNELTSLFDNYNYKLTEEDHVKTEIYYWDGNIESKLQYQYLNLKNSDFSRPIGFFNKSNFTIIEKSKKKYLDKVNQTELNGSQGSNNYSKTKKSKF